MSILFLLIPISLMLLGAAIWAFFWAVDSDQFDDLSGPAYSILYDEDEQETLKQEKNTGGSPTPPEAQDEAASVPPEKKES